MKRATYQVRLCTYTYLSTSYAKNVRGVPPKSILLVREHYLICPQRRRLVERGKPVSRPISLSLVPQQIRPLLIGCLSWHSKWQPTCPIPIGPATCQSHLSRPVTVRLRRQKEEGLPLSLFIYFFVSRRKKKQPQRYIPLRDRQCFPSE